MNGSTHITSAKLGFILPLFVTLALTLGGCATGPSTPPAPSYGMIPMEHSGARVLEHNTIASIKDGHSLITIRPDSGTVRSGVRPSFSVVAVNVGSPLFSFGVHNVSVSYNGAPVNVLSEAALMAEVQNRRAQEKSDSMFAGMLTTAAIALTESGTSEYGGVNLYNTQLGQSIVNQAFSADAAQQDQADQVAEAMLAEYKDTILKTSTVPPEGRHGGSFIMEAVSPQHNGVLEIAIRVGDSLHTVRFRTDRL